MAYDLEQILPSLSDADEQVRLGAAMALEEALKEELEGGRIEWESLVDRILPILITGIGDRHKGVQVHSANCLEFLCYQSERIIPALREAMANAGAWQAWGAAIVTARMGYWFPEMASALSAAMGATDRDVRWAAAGFSLQLGRNHPEAVAMVKATLAAENPLGRRMAAYTLGAMGQFTAVENALAERLGDPERDVRRAVILALDKLPEVSGPVREAIAAMRQDPDPFVQRTAEAVAAKLGV